MTSCLVRPATLEDATAAVAVLRESITHLCVEDHRNDPATLERWLQHKTTGQFQQWLTTPGNVVVVAELDSVLCGVGMLNRRGNLQLCYVLPGRQRTGLGRALMEALEAQARSWGLAELRLSSTAGARAFYERQGYLPVGEASVPAFGILREYLYRKPLGPPAGAAAASV